MKVIDLNADLGEGFPHDQALLEVVTSANIACGGHAGNLQITRQTIEFCLEAGVRVGAHPGFPDRVSMGREPAPYDRRKAYRDAVLDQVHAFMRIAAPHYIKPHGALYNGATVPGWEADLVAEALSLLPNPRLMGLPGTHHEQIARNGGARFEAEGFADRAYLPDGTLVPRGQEGALLSRYDDVLGQALRLADSVDSICLHGDTPECLEFARKLRTALGQAGFTVRCP